MATQMTTSFSINNGTTLLAFSSLCERRPATDQIDGGKYVTTLCIKKGSKDELDFKNGYEAAAREAREKYQVEVPPLFGCVLKDGDMANAKRVQELDQNGQPKKPFEFYADSWFIKVSSQYPIRLYDRSATEKKAYGPNNQPIRDGQYDTYYIPDIDGSKVSFSIKFNVGFSNLTGKTYARPYLDWIQQIVPSERQRVSFNGPTAWTGAIPTPDMNVQVVNTPAQPQTMPQTAPMPNQYGNQNGYQYGNQGYAPQTQAYQNPNAPQAPQMAIQPQPDADAFYADDGMYNGF